MLVHLGVTGRSSYRSRLQSPKSYRRRRSTLLSRRWGFRCTSLCASTPICYLFPGTYSIFFDTLGLAKGRCHPTQPRVAQGLIDLLQVAFMGVPVRPLCVIA